MSTKKAIEKLRAEYETLKQEKADLETRMAAAAMALYAAEREARRNEKLTPAMRKVLTEMSKGAVLISSRFNLPVSYWLERDGKHETVRGSVFSGLRSREAVDDGKRDGTWREVHQITEHGRSLVGGTAEINEAAA